MHKIYLAHPFESHELMRNWEQRIVQNLRDVKFINPFYDNYKKEFENWSIGDRSNDDTYRKLNPEGIVTRDVELIKSVDQIIAIVNGQISYGTIQEMVYAKILNRPVNAVISNGHHNHPWLQFHSDRVFTDLSKLEEYLYALHNTQ